MNKYIKIKTAKPINHCKNSISKIITKINLIMKYECQDFKSKGAATKLSNLSYNLGFWIHVHVTSVPRYEHNQSNRCNISNSDLQV